jgi:hypothetical protein
MSISQALPPRNISGGAFHNPKNRKKMATIKGQNLRIFLHEPGSLQRPACIAAATSCTAHIALQVQEDTTKDNENDWIENEPVGVNWEVDVEALVVNEDEGGAYTAADLIVGMVYDVRFRRTLGAAGSQNRDDTNSLVNMRGDAILSDLTINAQVGNITTYNAKLTGNGELRQSQASSD